MEDDTTKMKHSVQTVTLITDEIKLEMIMRRYNSSLTTLKTYSNHPYQNQQLKIKMNYTTNHLATVFQMDLRIKSFKVSETSY